MINFFNSVIRVIRLARRGQDRRPLSRNDDVHDILNQRMEQASEAISNLNSIIGGMGVFLTIFVAVSGLSVYFFGIKPSQDAVEKLEQTMDMRISLYLEEERKNQIDRNIDSLIYGSPFAKQTSNILLQNTVITHKLNDAQMLKLIAYAKKKGDDDYKSAPTDILFVNGKSELAQDFFLSILKRQIVAEGMTWGMMYHTAQRYFNNYTTGKEYREAYEEMIEVNGYGQDRAAQYYYDQALANSPNKETALSVMYSDKMVLKLLEAVTKDDLPYWPYNTKKEYYENKLRYFMQKGGTEIEFQETLFYKKIIQGL